MDSKRISFRLINRDVLKYIALAAMFIGHFLAFTAEELHFFGMPKGIAAFFMQFTYIVPPIFFFFIDEGFYYTHSKKAYAIRLFVFALITQIPCVLCNNMTFDIHKILTEWNVIMTLFLGLVVLIIWESKLKLPLRLLLIAACFALNFWLKTEWRISGILIILTFHLLRERPIIRLVVYELIILGYFAISLGGFEAILDNLSIIAIMTLPVLIITFLYNGEKGRFPKFSKYFFYIFYPLHYLLIFFVKLIAG